MRPEMPWTRTGVVSVEKDAHASALAFMSCGDVMLSTFLPGFDRAVRGFGKSVEARMIGRPLLARIFRPSSTWVPASRTMTGMSIGLGLQRLDDALGDPVAAIDAGEDVDQDRLHLVVRAHQAKGLSRPDRGWRRRRCPGNWRDCRRRAGSCPWSPWQGRRRSRCSRSRHRGRHRRDRDRWRWLRAGPPGTCRAVRRFRAGGTCALSSKDILASSARILPSVVTTSGLISTMVASRSRKAR